MDPSALTFGVELEFALAWSKILDSNDDRKTFFEHTDRMNDYWNHIARHDVVGGPEEPDTDDLYNETVSKWAVYHDIATTLTEAGIDAYSNPFDSIDLSAPDTTRWFIDDDYTVSGPKNSKYKWHSIEIASPKYAFTEDNVRVVKKAYISILAGATRVLHSQPSKTSSASFGLLSHNSTPSILLTDAMEDSENRCETTLSCLVLG